MLRIASFDIGKKNFAFCVEEFNLELIPKTQLIPRTKRYNPNNTPVNDFNLVLNTIYKNGKIILYENVDLTKNSQSSKSYLDTIIFHEMNTVLDKYIYIWDTCSDFVIEKQFSQGKNHNTMALKLGQHCWSYFCFKYATFKNIVEFPAYYKTQILGAQKEIGKNGKFRAPDKKTRKKWTVKKAQEILELRNDPISLKLIKTVKKKDDLGDIVCQLQAFKILYYMDQYKKI